MKNNINNPVIIVIVLIFFIFLSSCVSQPEIIKLHVFAASSLTDAFEEIGTTFEEMNSGVNVQYNFAGSSTLSIQLLEGAPADLFASANPIQMKRVEDQGVITNIPVKFATNRLTIITPKDNPRNIFSLADLAKQDISLILAAPGVPVREYSDQVILNLENPIIEEAIYQNIVSEEQNVRIVVSKVALGEADAGIVYTSDLTPEVAGHLFQVVIPEDINIIAVYLMAMIEESANPALSEEFINFVLSPTGQAILQKWGFGPIPNKN